MNKVKCQKQNKHKHLEPEWTKGCSTGVVSNE